MDSLFKALGDPVRRALLDSLRQRDGQTLTELSAPLQMSRFGVMKHLGLLEDAGLITTVKRGRFKHHYLNPVPLQELVDRWIDPLLAAPATRGLLTLKAHLEGDTAMSDTATELKPDFVLHTFIRCSQDALWRALTNADAMAAYHFACSAAEGDAGAGATTTFRRDDGSTMITQRTLAIDPQIRLEMSFEPDFGEVKTPSRVVYTVEPQGEICKLTCEHYQIAPGQEGVKEGWARWAASLKSWLETGQPIKL